MADIAGTLERIAADRRDDPLAPITVVVPSHVAALQLRRRLASRHGPFAGVRFETLARIAELLAGGRLAAAGRSPLARPIADYVTQVVARESRLGLAGVAELPGYARVLRQAFRRLRRGGITRPEQLRASFGSGYLPEVIRLYGLFRERTAAFYDEEDLLDTAASVARTRQRGILTDLGAIFVLPPGPQSAGGAALLSALRREAPAFTRVDETRARATHRFVLAPDPASEAREAVREVIEALEDGLGLHEIAVFHGADSSYSRLLCEGLTAAGIPVSPLPGARLIDTPAGRAVLGLATLPDEDYSRAAVFDVLSVAPLRDVLPGRDGPVRGLVTAWDRLSRRAGVTHGLDRWRGAMAALMADFDALASEDETRRAALESDVGRGQDLLNFIETLVRRLSVLQPDQAAADFIPRFKALIQDYFELDTGAIDAVMAEIDQLGTVDAVGGRFSLASFAAALRANLEVGAFREGRFGEGVLVADYRLAAGLAFERVVLCGATEGNLPAGPGPEPLLEAGVWSALRKDYPYVEDAVLRQERSQAAVARAIAAAGRGQIIWTAPLYEPGGTREHYPSEPMLTAAQGRDSAIETASDLRRAPARNGWLRRGASPLALMLQGKVADRGEASLRDTLARLSKSVATGPGHGLYQALNLLRARRGDRFSEWDGNLAALRDDVALRPSRPFSPTALEDYATCGFRYLCKSVWRLNVIDEPEEREVMDSAARGTLVHAVLADFFGEQQKRGRPAVDEAWTAADRDRLMAILEAHLAAARERGKTGLDLFAEHDARAIRADLAAFLAADTEFRQATHAVPADFEVRTPEISIAGVTLHGIADRVDRTPDGRDAWIIDYKTGSAWSYRNLETNAAGPFDSGTKLQLATYTSLAGSVAEGHALYWFISRRGEFKRVPYDPTPANQQRFEATIGAIVASVDAGAFPPIPGEENERYSTFDNCRYCDFDRICSRRRDAEFVAKQDDDSFIPWLTIGRVARGEMS